MIGLGWRFFALVALMIMLAVPIVGRWHLPFSDISIIVLLEFALLFAAIHLAAQAEDRGRDFTDTERRVAETISAYTGVPVSLMKPETTIASFGLSRDQLVELDMSLEGALMVDDFDLRVSFTIAEIADRLTPLDTEASASC